MPGNSAISLETGSCTIILTRVDPLSRNALRAAARSTEIAQYLRRLRAIILTHVDPLSRDALRATEKKVSLILVIGSQSYLSWFIVSLLRIKAFTEFDITVTSFEQTQCFF